MNLVLNQSLSPVNEGEITGRGEILADLHYYYIFTGSQESVSFLDELTVKFDRYGQLANGRISPNKLYQLAHTYWNMSVVVSCSPRSEGVPFDKGEALFKVVVKSEPAGQVEVIGQKSIDEHVVHSDGYFEHGLGYTNKLSLTTVAWFVLCCPPTGHIELILSREDMPSSHYNGDIIIDRLSFTANDVTRIAV